MLSNSIATLRGVKSGLRHMAGRNRALILSFCLLFSQAAAEKSVSSRGGSPGRKGGAGGGQEAFLSDERRRYLLQRTAFRTAWVGLTLIIAVEIPDFLGFMGLIGNTLGTGEALLSRTPHELGPCRARGRPPLQPPKPHSAPPVRQGRADGARRGW